MRMIQYIVNLPNVWSVLECLTRRGPRPTSACNTQLYTRGVTDCTHANAFARCLRMGFSSTLSTPTPSVIL
ncbi:hypothetical protein BGX38DRAFT_1192499 [Terfezia claveryi]|nr:hypothetical protein BGX38DRAFT_1192499 [Terfezia claveryi]